MSSRRSATCTCISNSPSAPASAARSSSCLNGGDGRGTGACALSAASPHPFAIGGRRFAELSLERPGKIKLIVIASAVGDLADGHLAEAQQPRRLKHPTVGDQFLGGAAGDSRKRPRERRLRNCQGIGVVRRIVMTHVVAFED